jgi:hypothetical protein
MQKLRGLVFTSALLCACGAQAFQLNTRTPTIHTPTLNGGSSASATSGWNISKNKPAGGPTNPSNGASVTPGWNISKNKPAGGYH